MTTRTDIVQVTLGKDDPTGGLRDFHVGLELRDVAAVGKPFHYLEGRAVPYGEWASLGLFMESHDAGSLKQSTDNGKGRGLPLLLFHDQRSFPIGVSEQWTHRDDGLDGRWKLNDSPEAQRAAGAAERGELTGLSIGFQPIRSRWEFVAWDDWDPELGPDHMDKVTREESRLVEVSVVSGPAFPSAQVTDVRSVTSTTSMSPRDVYVGFRAVHRGDPPAPEADRWRDITDGLRSRQR